MRWWSLLCLVACGSPQPAPTAPPAPVEYAPREIPPLPDLPPVPEAPPACEPFDLHNPACRNDPRMCTLGYADCKCPSPPDVDLPACWATMPCPDPPDRRVRACMPQHRPECADCPDSIVIGRVLQVADKLVTIGVGTQQGIDATWTAALLVGDSQDLLPGGEVRIVRVGRRETVGEVRVDTAVLEANPHVRFTRPK